MPDEHRSFEKLEEADLKRLAEVATEQLSGLFDRKPDRSGLYRDRCLLMCLCQGGARHFVHGDRGIKDLDVWAFFRPHPKMKFPVYWRGTADFGPSRFGRDPNEDPSFLGRRVDVLGRDIPVLDGDTGVDAVRRYLDGKRTGSAWHLAQRPVIALWPDQHFGEIVWQGA